MTSSYSKKQPNYFSGARKLFIDDLPLNPEGRLLEVGCGTGDTSAYALSQGKCGWCCGIELTPASAAEAKAKLQHVIIGDVETVEIGFEQEYFDVLILSEVLEHLVDPWSTLSRLYGFLKPGALIRAGSPNVAHYSTLQMLLRGRWDLSQDGIMDITHLRWFTPASYRSMFESCGYIVDSVRPAEPLRPKAWLLNAFTFGRLQHLFHNQIYLKARRSSTPERSS